MKQIKLEINIEACHYDELTEKDRKLIDAACEATKEAMLLTHILLLEPPHCWKMISSLPEPIKKMQPTHLVFVQNVPLCFMPILNIRIKQ